MELKIFVTEQEIFLNTKNFKNHREYIKYRFKKEHNAEVTQFHTSYTVHGVKKGLKFMKADSDIYLAFEVIGVLGESLQYCKEA